MHAGLGQLRLSPQSFWAITMRELAFALGHLTSRDHTPSRHVLDTLMRAFPDRDHHDNTQERK